MKALKAGASRLFGFLACLAPSVLLTAALARIITAYWPAAQLPLGELALVSLGACLVFAGLTANGITLVIGLLGLVIGSGLLLLMGFIPWLAALVAAPNALLGALIPLPLALLTVALSRRRVMLPPLVILTGGILLLLSVLQTPPTLAATAAAVVALVAYTARSALHRWTVVLSARAEGLLALWILPVALALVLLCTAWIAGQASLPKWDKLAEKFEYLENYIADMTGSSEPRTSFSLVSTGMQPDPQQLGGPVQIRDAAVLAVTSDDPTLLLRGAVYGDYNGHTWYNGATATRFKLASGAQLDAAFDRLLPVTGDLPMTEVTLAVDHLTDGPSSLFVPFRLDSVTPKEALSLLLNFNGRGEVFASRDIPAGRGYTVQATLPTTDLAVLSAWIDSHTEAEDPGYDLARSLYLGLPANLPDTVRLLAAQLTQNAHNDAEAVAALADYLARNTTYTLTPEVPPVNRDFVAHFLETKAGYCTYYASAMAVLGRCAGVPTRYVEGYRLPENARAGEEVILTQAMSHAWCEVYLAGIGWIPMDVTQEEESESGAESQAPQPTPTPTPEPSSAPPPPEDPPPPERTPPPPPDLPRLLNWKPILRTLAVLLALAALLFLPPWLRARAEARRCRTVRGAIRCHYEAILRLLGYIGLAPQTGETPAALAARLEDALPLPRADAFAVAEVLMRLAYSPAAVPNDNDVRVLVNYRRHLERAIQKDHGRVFYLLRETLRLIR